jgi:hypothetical protein
MTCLGQVILIVYISKRTKKIFFSAGVTFLFNEESNQNEQEGEIVYKECGQVTTLNLIILFKSTDMRWGL